MGENDKFEYLEFGFSSGYFLMRNEKFHIAPYASITLTSLMSNLYVGRKNRTDYELKVLDTYMLGGGIHTAINLYESTEYIKNLTGIYFNLELRLDMGYNYIMNHTYELFEGDMYYMRMGLVLTLSEF